jgi:hypothetical protein
MTATMDTVVTTLVAVLTEGDAQPMKPLLYMVSVRWTGLATDSARQRLDRGQMLAIRGSQVLAVHRQSRGAIRLCLLREFKSIEANTFLASLQSLHLLHLSSHCLKILHLTLSGDGLGFCMFSPKFGFVF